LARQRHRRVINVWAAPSDEDRETLGWLFKKVSIMALEEIEKLQCFISHECTEQDRACAMDGDDTLLAAARESQRADIDYLLTWAHDEIWLMQQTTGSDTNCWLSRVVAVVLTVLFGSAFPLMHRMQKLHSVPSKKVARTGQDSTTQIWKYENGALIHNVMDTATLATCRDYPEGIIPYLALKGMLFLAAQPGSLEEVHLAASDQNGRMGISCHYCALFRLNDGKRCPRRRNVGVA
jgi:hypothetical protein